VQLKHIDSKTSMKQLMGFATQGIEVLPGNSEIVHHVLVYQDTSSVPDSLDALTPELGYEGIGGFWF